jgi:hypothetical protein
MSGLNEDDFVLDEDSEDGFIEDSDSEVVLLVIRRIY